MDGRIEQQIVAALAARMPEAALAAELEVTVAPRRALDEALQRMAAARTVLVADHAAPDIHLESADLRVVALVRADDDAAAMAAADGVWDEWLRGFFSTHRCQ
jgi:hypothetical protein